jgi:hypothetical protein
MHIWTRGADSLERNVGHKHEDLRKAKYVFDGLAGIEHFVDPVVNQFREAPGLAVDAVTQRVTSRTAGDFHQVIGVFVQSNLKGSGGAPDTIQAFHESALRVVGFEMKDFEVDE